MMVNEPLNPEVASQAIREVTTGEKKHASLGDASTWAMFNEPGPVADMIHEKFMEQTALLNELTAAHLESGGALFPGVTMEGNYATWSALHALALQDPGRHPALKKIHDLEAYKFMVGGKTMAGLN